MRSLAPADNVKVKLMEIPPWKEVIPFTRVNHSKYMITDNEAYITTSNWTPDYFLHTGGVSICFRNADFQSDIQTIFDRYARSSSVCWPALIVAIGTGRLSIRRCSSPEWRIVRCGAL